MDKGNKGNFFRGIGEQRPKKRGTGEHRQFWGIGNIENQDFVFGEQGNKVIFSREQGNTYPPTPAPNGRASVM